MNCLNCNTFKNTKNNFCSQDCFIIYKRHKKLSAWKDGIIDGTKKGCRLIRVVREYLLEQSNHKCSKCGWGEINPHTKKTPLEINHIDGNSVNNRPENLEVICPNCHSLTSTWKALNKGNGNKERLRYSKLIE